MTLLTRPFHIFDLGRSPPRHLAQKIIPKTAISNGWPLRMKVVSIGTPDRMDGRRRRFNQTFQRFWLLVALLSKPFHMFDLGRSLLTTSRERRPEGQQAHESGKDIRALTSAAPKFQGVPIARPLGRNQRSMSPKDNPTLSLTNRRGKNSHRGRVPKTTGHRDLINLKQQI